MARPARGFLDAEAYAACLAGTPPAKLLPEEALFTREVRAGIGLDPAGRRVLEGRLFSSEGVALEDGCGFLLEVEGLDPFPTEGLLRLGGDGRMARVETVSPRALPLEAVREGVVARRRLRLIFRTPARFRGGWLPAGVRREGEEFHWEYGGFRFRLVGALLGEPAPVGGWDLVRRAPKVLRPAVPAGAVYWLELLAGDPARAFAALHGAALDEVAPHEGFGIVHVGAW